MSFLSGLAALGGAGQGIVEGEQLKQQRELQKAQLEKTRAETNQAIMANISQQIMAHPELKTNANYNKLIKTYGKQYGMTLPMTPAGEIDWSILGANRGGLQDIKEQLGMTPAQVKEQPTEQQKQLAKQFPDAAAFIGDGQQTVPLLPRSVQEDKRDIEYRIAQLGDGAITVNQLDAIAHVAETDDPEMKGVVEAIVNADTQKLGQVGLGLQSRIDNLKSLGIIRKDDLNLKHEEFHSLDDYRQFEKKHLTEVDSETHFRDLQHIDEANQHIEIERQNTQIARDRLNLAIKKATTPGGKIDTPIEQLDKDARATKAYLQTLQAEYSSAQRDARMEYDQNGAYDQATLDHMNALQKEIKEQSDLLSNYTQNSQAVRAASLRAAGVNVKTDPNAPKVETYHGRPALYTIKGQPIFANDAGNGYVDAQGHPVK